MGFADPYTRYVMVVLFIVYVMGYIDRQLASVLLEHMKEDLNATDTQMGLLTGVAFAGGVRHAGRPGGALGRSRRAPLHHRHEDSQSGARPRR